MKKYAIFQLKGNIPQRIETPNFFDTEEEALQYLKEHKMTYGGYGHYCILPFYRMTP